MGIGRVMNGKITTGNEIAYGKPDGSVKKGKINEVGAMIRLSSRIIVSTSRTHTHDLVLLDDRCLCLTILGESV